MDEQSNRPAPPHVLEALEASARDVAEERLFDARAVQAEARRMLDEYKAARSGEFPAKRARPLSHFRSAD